LRLLDDAADRGVTTWAELERFSASRKARSKRRLTALPTSTLDDRIA
jgi:hypothetical protein